MTTVLIIDDDDSMRHALTRTVQRMGCEAFNASTLAEGLILARQQDTDAVFLDVRLPDGNGLTMLPELASMPSKPEVIIITGAGDPDGAELAISNGAWDYIEKTDSIRKITLTLQRALDFRRERQGSECKPVRALRRDAIVGDSTSLARSLDLVAQSSGSDMNVLITGETGTGKELFARAIHDNSERASGPFVVVDCAALPETLVESILFGHSKGAFTGADKNQQGLVMQAHGGTLFLDEIGELPPSLQKAFLRVLQEHTIRPLGSQKELHSDFRLVAATNRNLDLMVQESTFRSDLLYRIRSLHIDLPPLRDRKSDLRALASHHVDRFCDKHGYSTKGLSSDFLDALKTYDWPGNVRELVHTLEHAVTAAAADPTLFSKHLPSTIRTAVAQKRMAPAQEESPLPHEFPASKDSSLINERSASGDISCTAGIPVRKEFPAEQETLSSEHDADKTNDFSPPQQEILPMQEFRDKVIADAEKQYLTDLLRSTGRNMKEAINKSGLSQSRLYALLKKYGLNSQGR